MENTVKKNYIFSVEHIKHKWLCLSMATLFMGWSALDFLSLDPYSPIFITVRFLIFSATIIFVSNLNRKSFMKHHRLISSILLTTITTVNTFFVLVSQTPIVSAAFQLVLYTTLPTLFIVRPKFFLPVILVPFIIYASSILFITNSSAFSTLALLSITLITAILTISQYISLNFVQNAYKNFNKLESSQKSVSSLLEENNQLVRILCHDLGNSLTIIELSSTLISTMLSKQDIVSPLLLKNMDRIERAIFTQKEIIEHVKNKEALESGKYQVNIQPVNISIVLEKVKFIFQDQLQKKNLSLSINYQSEQSPFVAAEMVSLSNNVINNIVSNAIKFSPDNSEIIICTWKDRDDVYLTVEDFGIGMDEKLIKDIFKANIKTSRIGLNGEKGTGFGVPLAKTYMQKYGGDLFVESKENKGTRFTLKFNSIDSIGTRVKKAS